jgi:putative restriction endonuclease
LKTNVKMTRDWEGFAARAWEVMTDLAATEENTIDYSALEIAVGFRPVGYDKPGKGRHANRFLVLVARYCHQKGLPILTVMATDRNGDYGEGVMEFIRYDLAQEIAAVRSFDWPSVGNPFLSAEDKQLAEALLAVDSENRGDVLAAVAQRGRAQAIFREALLKAYGNRCAVCEVCHPDFLEAAHLIPWRVATEVQRVDVRNGLLLCRNHHVGFDRGWWKVYHDGKRFYPAAIIKGSRQSGLPSLMMDALRLPQRREWRPKKSWLVDRR